MEYAYAGHVPRTINPKISTSCLQTLPSLSPSPPLQQKSLLRSVYYMLRDFAALAALYFIYPTVQAKYGLPGLFVWWNLAGKEGREEGSRQKGRSSICV